MGSDLLHAPGAPLDVAEAPVLITAEPRTVVHLISSNFFGGPEKQILEHCLRLDPRRWRAVVGSFREGRARVDLVAQAEGKGLPVFLVQTRSPFSPALALELAKALRRHRADLLVTHGYKPTAVGLLARRFRRVPQVPFVRGYTAETWKVRRYESLDRYLLRRAFLRVGCVSEATRRLLVGHGVRPERIIPVHNAVEVREDVTPSPLREEFGIPAASAILVAAGRLSAEKGHRFLVEALARFPAETRPHLVILGEGRERERLRGFARTLEVSQHVHLAGFRDNPLSFLAAADLVVNPSLTEGLPNVVLEAQSLGVPVVATDVGGVSELVTDGETGWLVPAGDPDALANALRAALGDPVRARALGEAGRSRVRGNFSFTRQAERLMALYDDAVGD